MSSLFRLPAGAAATLQTLSSLFRLPSVAVSCRMKTVHFTSFSRPFWIGSKGFRPPVSLGSLLSREGFTGFHERTTNLNLGEQIRFRRERGGKVRAGQRKIDRRQRQKAKERVEKVLSDTNKTAGMFNKVLGKVNKLKWKYFNAYWSPSVFNENPPVFCHARHTKIRARFAANDLKKNP